MTDNNHPITPPPQIVQQIVNGPGTWLEKISKAYCAGADQELEACCEWMVKNFWLEPRGKSITELRAARRPKAPSLKEEALAELDLLRGDANTHGLGFDAPAIRRALESLPS